jgi:hypothetical protein
MLAAIFGWLRAMVEKDKPQQGKNAKVAKVYAEAAGRTGIARWQTGMTS